MGWLKLFLLGTGAVYAGNKLSQPQPVRERIAPPAPGEKLHPVVYIVGVGVPLLIMALLFLAAVYGGSATGGG